MKYHKIIGIPSNVKIKTLDFIGRLKGYNLSFLPHAEMELFNERDIKGIKERIAEYTPAYKDIFEVVEYGTIEKLGFRIPYNSERDIIFILNCYGKIVTIWTNKKEDLHKTLNKQAYAMA